MAVEKKVIKQDESIFSKVDWIDFGVKVAASVGTALATGYISAAGNDIYHTRKARKLSKQKGSNVHLLENKRTA